MTSLRDTGRKSRTCVEAGHFAAFLDTEDPLPWQSIAFPLSSDAECAATAEEGVAGLRRIFAEHGRLLRFELFDALYPRLIDALVRAGLRRGHEQPVMLCLPAGLRTPADRGIAVRAVKQGSPEELLRTFVRVQSAAFDAEAGGEALDAGARFLRRDLASGRLRCATASLEGQVVAAASLVGVGRVVELAGVGTLPEARRRGAASAVSAALVAGHFAGGGDLVWLTAGDDAAGRVYAGLGFVDAGVLQVNLEEPSRGAALG